MYRMTLSMPTAGRSADMRFSPQYSFQSQGVLNPQPSGFAFLSAGFFFVVNPDIRNENP